MRLFGSLHRPARVIALAATTILAASVTAGCFQTPDAANSPQKAAPAPQATLPVDPAGRWCFKEANGRAATNKVEVVQGGIITSPVGRAGNEVFYPKVGPNLYRLGNGAAYEFYDNTRGVRRRGQTEMPYQRCG